MEPRPPTHEEPSDTDAAPGEHVPATVFWQRRAVVGLLLVALVAGLTVALASWRNRASAAESAGGPPATAASATTGASPAQSPATSPAASVSPTAPASAAPAITCDVAQLVLRVSGPERVKAGTQAGLVVTFTNVGTDTCILPLNPQTFLLKITSGTDEIWKSIDCAGWGPDSSTTLAPGQTLEWTMSWNRHRSNKCTVVAGDLLPGTYVATASWRNGPSARHVMILVW